MNNKLRVMVEGTRLSKLCSYAGEYLELITRNNVCVLCSESGAQYTQLTLKLMEAPIEDVQIRVPSSIVSKLSRETIIDFIITDSEVRCQFYDKQMVHLYSKTILKQRGVIDPTDKLEFLKTRLDYTGYSLAKISALLSTMKRLDPEIMCLNNVAYCTYNNSHIFTKMKLPNFCISAKSLSTIVNSGSPAYFMGRYIYTRFEDSGLDVFLTKGRVPMTTDIGYIMSMRYSHKIKINAEFIRLVVRNMSISNDAKINLDLPNNEMTIEDGKISVTINVPVIDVTTNKDKKKDEDSVEDLLGSLTEETTINLDNDVNRYNLPKLAIPKWVLVNIINQDETTIYLSKRCVIFSTHGGRVLIPRA